MKRIILATTALGIAAAAGFGFLAGGSGGALTYRTTAITRGNVESTISTTGTLGAVNTVQVGTQISGQVSGLYADFNDRVKKGQLLARLDPTLLQQSVQQAQADVERSSAEVRQREYAMGQATALYQIQGITETEYRTGEYDLAVSRANLKSAESGLERARQNLQYTSVHSPVDGVVIERTVSVGQTVAASLSAPQLFLIAEDLSHMEILASVDESDIGQIKEGQSVRFTVQAYANRTFAGTVRQVRMQSETTEGVVNYTVVIAVANPDAALLPGMTATVSFELAQAIDVLRVPNAALRFRPTDAMLAAVPQPAGDSTPPATETTDATVRVRLASTGATGGAQAGSLAQGRGSVTQLWYLDEQGVARVARVRVGLSDGQMTQIAGPDLREGLQVITSVTTGADGTTATASPFSGAAPSGGPPVPGGF